VKRNSAAAGSIAPTGSTTILVQSHLWVWWAEIAIEQERIAAEAREVSLAQAVREDAFKNAFTRETRASMVAVAAASHSLDALFGVVVERIARPTTEKRWSLILETLKTGFDIRGRAGGGEWAREFEWLYDLRDAAVHARESLAPPVPHPTGTHAGPEHVRYALESATRSVSLLLSVLENCAANPRPPLREWAANSLSTVKRLAEQRV
jgi:hypothetical protein